MKYDPKVSIIVIIYRVAPFLSECLDSIITQTYENTEIICVVGEGDEECEEIAREYEKKDSRIKLLINLPRGTAAARNEGLSAAGGELIAFVDGDDHIESDMIETMVRSLTDNDADISVVGRYYDYENRTDADNAGSKFILNRKEVYEILLYQTGFFLHIWDKLYRRELFNGISFDTGKKVEDREVVFKLLGRAKKTVYDSTPKYHFRVSQDSGSRVSDNLLRSLESDRVITDEMLRQYPDLKKACDFFLVYETISVIQNDMLKGTYSSEYDKEHLTFVRKHLKDVCLDKRVRKAVKLKIILCSYFPGILKKMTLKRRKEYLDTHKEFTTGTDWAATFKEQGVE
ncbi:MAG: glycosyltransferase [Lachnospiraceae bacterium]|nr:glycosyltransferase [Lachnospiraceae bacterium]